METPAPNSSARLFGLSNSLVGFGLGVLILSAAALWAYQLPITDTLKFVFGTLVLFFIPGNLVIRLAGFRGQYCLTNLILSLATGVVLVPAVYKMLQGLVQPGLVVTVLVSICATIWLASMFRDRTRISDNGGVPRDDLIALAGLLLLTLFLLHLSHFSDVVLSTDGFQFRTHYMSESVYHLGLINALTDGYPPPSIYASGGPDYSFYHLNMHLQADLLIRLLGLGSFEVVSFYLPFLYFVLLLSLPYVFVRECGGKVLTAAVCAILVFGADFSFIPSIFMTSTAGFAWTGTFESKIWGLFTLNGVIPGLIALFLGIHCLRDYFLDGSVKKLVFLVLITLGAFGFKSSVGFQLGLAAAATGLGLGLFGFDRNKSYKLMLAAMLVVLLMLFDLFVLKPDWGHSIVVLYPLLGFKTVLAKLGLSDLGGVWYLPLFLSVLLGGLGLRMVGFYFLYSQLRQRSPLVGLTVFIGLFFLSGIAASELFFIGDPTGLNNSKWFYIQALMAVWYLSFFFLISLQDRKQAWLASLIIMVLLSAPSTVQFLILRYDNSYVNYGAEQVQIIDYLRETEPDSVVLHPLNQHQPSLASNFAGRSTVLSVWLSFVGESEGLSGRANDTLAFFDADTPEHIRTKILNHYGVDYIYGTRSELLHVRNLPGLELALNGEKMELYRVQ